MTIVRILRDPVSHLISGFQAEGHSGFANHGEDLVCAGISALTMTALLGIESIACIDDFITSDEQKAVIDCRIPLNTPEKNAETARIILSTMRLGLIEMAGQYPKYLMVVDEGGANHDPF